MNKSLNEQSIIRVNRSIRPDYPIELGGGVIHRGADRRPVEYDLRDLVLLPMLPPARRIDAIDQDSEEIAYSLGSSDLREIQKIDPRVLISFFGNAVLLGLYDPVRSNSGCINVSCLRVEVDSKLELKWEPLKYALSERDSFLSFLGRRFLCGGIINNIPCPIRQSC